MFSRPFKLLKQRILSRVPEIKKVSWYVRGFVDESGEPLFELPACMIEFLPAAVESRTGAFPGSYLQHANARFRIHLLWHLSFNEDAEVEPLALLDKLYAALQGWSGKLSDLKGFESLAGTDKDLVVLNTVRRKSIIPDHQPIDVLMVAIEFESVMMDDSGIKPVHTLILKPDVKATLED